MVTRAVPPTHPQRSNCFVLFFGIVGRLPGSCTAICAFRKGAREIARQNNSKRWNALRQVGIVAWEPNPLYWFPNVDVALYSRTAHLGGPSGGTNVIVRLVGIRTTAGRSRGQEASRELLTC